MTPPSSEMTATARMKWERALTLVRDPVQNVSDAVGDEHRTVGKKQQVGRPAPILSSLQPTFGDRFVVNCPSAF